MEAVQQKAEIVAHLIRVAVARCPDLGAQLCPHLLNKLALQSTLLGPRGPCDVLVGIDGPKEAQGWNKVAPAKKFWHLGGNLKVF